jgi:hypothetical protein
MAMREPTSDAAAPVDLQPISLDSFEENDAPVKSGEIKFTKVDMSKVRKMLRRRTQRLRWAAPAPRKKQTLPKPAEQSPSSPHASVSRDD